MLQITEYNMQYVQKWAFKNEPEPRSHQNESLSITAVGYAVLLNRRSENLSYQNISQTNYDWRNTNKFGNDIYRKWNYKRIKYDWVDKTLERLKIRKNHFPGIKLSKRWSLSVDGLSASHVGLML